MAIIIIMIIVVAIGPGSRTTIQESDFMGSLTEFEFEKALRVLLGVSATR